MPQTEPSQRGTDRRENDRRVSPLPIDFVDRRRGDRRSGIDRRATRDARDA